MTEAPRHLSAAVVLLSALVLAACDLEVPQLVSGKFEPSFGPPPAVVLLLEGKSCAGTPIQSAVSSTGEFSFQLSSVKGGVGVVTQELSLCANGVMEPLWYSLHGGGAAAIELLCLRPAGDEGFCESRFTYGEHGA